MSSAKKIKSTRSRGQSSAVGERFGNAVQPQVPTQDEINEVIRLFSGGQLEAAERHAAALTRRHPSHPFGWKALGGVRRLRGRVRESLEPMKRATRLAPGDAEAHSNLAKTLMDLGQLEAAEASYREAIRLRPEHVVAHLYLGDLLQLCGRLQEAEACLREAIRLKADVAETHFRLGQILLAMGDLNAAEECYRHALRLDPDSAMTHASLGIVLNRLARLEESEASCREAIRLKPDYAEAHCNRGVALEGLGQVEAAAACYREAARLNPGLAAAHNNLGNALASLGQFERAAVSYRDAIRVSHDYAEAHLNLGVVLQKAGKLKDAELSLREAVRLRCDIAEGHAHLGGVLKDLGRLTDAECSYREAIRLKPDYAIVYSNLGASLMRLGRFDDAVENFRRAIQSDPTYYYARSNMLFGLNYIEAVTAERMLDEARTYGEFVSDRAHPKFTSWQPVSKRRLRVGFVSSDLRNHSVGFFAEGLIKNIDSERFELFAFSNSRQCDALSERIRPYFIEWVLIADKGDLEAAQMIHDRGIDILVDLSGHTAHNRLPVFSHRPAPVQVSWLGYFASTGLPEIDYFIGDPYLAPPSEAWHFTETLWRLPESWFCREPSSQAPAVGPLPAKQNRFVTFGCFGNLSKLGAGVEELWAKILSGLPDTMLLLKSSQFADPKIVKDVEMRFGSHGIRRDRLILEAPGPLADYYAAYNRVDMVLDTFPYPGGTTSVDALWMGVPILTLKGERFLSHLGESIAHNAGLPEWIAESEDDYVRKAVEFASDISALESIRAGLRERLRDGPLFNTKRFAAHFGDAIAQMYSTATSRKA